MNNIVLLNEEHVDTPKINLDELYDYKKQCDKNTLRSYNIVLQRIHTRIKMTSRQKNNEQFCWFVIPEVMIGVPKYDVASCIAYVIDQLKQNGFSIKYTHPNLIFISWKYWVPDYVRNEIKKKTGTKIDGNGNIIEDKNVGDNPVGLQSSSSTSHIKGILKPGTQVVKKEEDKKYTSINTYTPTGNSVYSNQLLQKLQNKV
tara:strand:+ start:4293 stop:4895 length:603 start_codon:yes stop_codon:yes gene_type:complete